ncbi:uncharacterized protein LOC108252734 isoform X1 [Diaphorina citri]|uniref:Uncharacterized protein LOC108252734 isoform X1 n=1 Tax=Diaphorina citri TaxID=121845 RepID=A0A1S4EF01_DIACI|nr:uncharacterized protein LOC108252734 isoform X1 [Diaphorina citri]
MSSGGSYSTPVAVKEERLLCCGRARSMTEQDIASLYSLLEVSSLSGYHKLLRRPKAVRERHLTISCSYEYCITWVRDIHYMERDTKLTHSLFCTAVARNGVGLETFSYHGSSAIVLN